MTEKRNVDLASFETPGGTAQKYNKGVSTRLFRRISPRQKNAESMGCGDVRGRRPICRASELLRMPRTRSKAQ